MAQNDLINFFEGWEDVGYFSNWKDTEQRFYALGEDILLPIGWKGNGIQFLLEIILLSEPRCQLRLVFIRNEGALEQALEEAQRWRAKFFLLNFIFPSYGPVYNDLNQQIS
jgi:hypothetical protein